MKGLFLALVIVVVLGAAFLALMPWSGPALAAGPAPGGTWVPPLGDPTCTTSSGAPGHLLVNRNSGKAHCFKD